MQNYFKNNITKNNFGKFIENELKGKIFDDKEIYHLYKISKKYLDIIIRNTLHKWSLVSNKKKIDELRVKTFINVSNHLDSRLNKIKLKYFRNKFN